MMSNSTALLRRAATAMVLLAVFAGLAVQPAQARIWVGIGVPFPGYYPAPYYYPPPVYYAPPPVVYAPPQTYSPVPAAVGSPGQGQSCNAGPYVCPMGHPVAPGSSCYCLGNGGQRVPGQAN